MGIGAIFNLKHNEKTGNTPARRTATSRAGSSVSIFSEVKTIFSSSKEDNKTSKTTNSIKNYTQTKQNSEKNAESLYNEIANIVSPLGISKEQLKSTNALSQILGNVSEKELLKNPGEVQRIKECVRIAAKVIKAKKLTPNTELLIKYSNDINVATVSKTYTLKEIEKSISKFRKKYVLDSQSIEGAIEKGNSDVKDFDKLSDNEKIKYIKKLFSKKSKKGWKIFQNRKEKQAKKQFINYVVNTADAHNRSLLINAIDQLDKKDQYMVLKSWTTSFKTDEEKTIMACSATEENLNEILSNENVTQNDAMETYSSIYKYDTEESAAKRVNDKAKHRKEFFEKHSNEEIQRIRRKKEIIEKIQNGETLTEDESNFIGQYGATLTEEENSTLREYENTLVASDASLSIAYPQNKNLSHEAATQLVRTNYENMLSCGNYYTEEVFQTIQEYVTTHQDSLNIKPEELTQFLDEVTGGVYSSYLKAHNLAMPSDEDDTKENDKQKVKDNKNNKNVNNNRIITKSENSKDAKVSDKKSNSELSVNNKQDKTEKSNNTEKAENTTTLEQVEKRKQSVKTNNRVTSETVEPENTNTAATEENTTQNIDIVTCKNTADVKECLNTNGKKYTIVEGLNNCKKIGTSVLKYIQEFYSRLDENCQTSIIKDLNSDGMSVAELYTKEGAFKDLVAEGYIFSNSAMTARINKKNMEIEQKEKNQSVFTNYITA